MTRRILLTITASVLLVLVAFLAPMWVLVGEYAVDRAQRHAVLQVQPLVSSVAVVPEEQAQALVADFAASTGYPTTLYYADGTTVGLERPVDRPVELARLGGAFFTDVPGGRDLLVPVVGAPGGTAIVRITVPDDVLYANVTAARLVLVALGLVLLGLAVLVGLLLARSFLRPISALASTAETLAGGDMAARVTPAGPPEIRSVGVLLNRLAGRVTDLLRGEREQVADLAHRLRTPVTALALDAEQLRDPAERDRLSDDVARLERMVDEVIREARRPVREGVTARCDAAEVVRERAAFWQVLAEDQGRPVHTVVPAQPIPVRVDEDDLGDTLDALLGNVFAHTPDGTGYGIRVVALAGGGAEVTVTDEGPGIASPDLLERGASGAGSTGLGLDIARRTAESSGGHLAVLPAPAPAGRPTGAGDPSMPVGTSVRLTLGPPPPDA